MPSEKKEKLSASLEDYLEAIYWATSEHGAARAKEIAQRLDVRAASVTGALRILAERQLINYAPYELITMTEAGREQARLVIRKHEILKGFFVDVLGLDGELAEDGACRMEHELQAPIMERLLSFTEFVQSCPRCSGDWRENFLNKCFRQSVAPCPDCVEHCIEGFKKGETVTLTEQPTRSLDQVRPGDKCIVKSIKNSRTTAKRLVEMGVSRGTVIEVERVAPLGDPIEVKVRGYHLSLRHDEAASIEVVDV